MSFEVRPDDLRHAAAVLDDAMIALLSAGDKLSRITLPADPHAGEGPDAGAALVRIGRLAADETFALKVATEQLAAGLRETALRDEAADHQSGQALRLAGGQGAWR